MPNYPTQPLNKILPGVGPLGAYGSDMIQVKQVSLTAANLTGMYAAPVEVLAAPGTGRTLVLLGALAKVTSGTAYTSGGAIVVQYNTGNVAAIATIPATFLTDGTNTEVFRIGKDAAAVTNDALEITNATGAFATGTGTVELFLFYLVV